MAFSSKHLTQGEHVELEFRTHIKKIVGPILLILAMLIVLILAWVYLPDDLSGRTWIFLGIVILALAVTFIWALIPIWKWRNTKFVLTNRRLITRTGIMAKSGRDIPLYRINDVQYEKGVADRMLGCGTLLISDASDQPQLRLDDIPHVESVQVKINELLFAHFDPEGGDRPAPERPQARGAEPVRDRGHERPPFDQQNYDEGYEQDYQRNQQSRDPRYDTGGTQAMPQQEQPYNEPRRQGQPYDQDQQGQPYADPRQQGQQYDQGQPYTDPRQQGQQYDQGQPYNDPHQQGRPPAGGTRPLPRQDEPPQQY